MGTPRTIELCDNGTSIYINFYYDGMSVAGMLARALNNSQEHFMDAEYLVHNIICEMYKEYPYRIGVSSSYKNEENDLLVIDLDSNEIFDKEWETFDVFIERHRDDPL